MLDSEGNAGRGLMGIARPQPGGRRSLGLRLAPEEGEQYAKNTHEAKYYADADNVAAQNPAEN